MPAEVTLTAEFSRQGLAELRDRIDELLVGVSSANSPVDSDLPEPQRAEMKVSALWERLGEKSRDYLLACARRPANEEFSLDELSQSLALEVGTVKAFHRNVSRSAADVEPKELELFKRLRETVSDGGRTKSVTKLRMNTHVRTAVLAVSERKS
jgi:hypothetical protein